MNIPIELIQLVGVLLGVGASFVFGVAWGRKYPSKADKIQEQLDALKAAIKKE